MIQKNNNGLLALNDFMGLSEDGDFVTERSIESLLAKFIERHVPAPEDHNSMTFFPTPAGSTWENVSIRFVDGHKVAVKVKAESGVFNFTQMGMASKKNGEPTVQWELLQAFAEERGELTWRSRKADLNLKRRKSNLARDLCNFFRIDGDPFVYEKTSKGWRTRFSIEPE